MTPSARSFLGVIFVAVCVILPMAMMAMSVSFAVGEIVANWIKEKCRS